MRNDFKFFLQLMTVSFILFLTVCFFASCDFKSNTDRHYESDVSNIQPVPVQDYQIKLKMSYDTAVKDSITLFDGNRKVGTVSLTWGEPFAELILSDNE